MLRRAWLEMVFGDAVVVIALLMVQSANLLQLRAQQGRWKRRGREPLKLGVDGWRGLLIGVAVFRTS